VFERIGFDLKNDWNAEFCIRDCPKDSFEEADTPQESEVQRNFTASSARLNGTGRESPKKEL
jgi:hypothetical protein